MMGRVGSVGASLGLVYDPLGLVVAGPLRFVVDDPLRLVVGARPAVGLASPSPAEDGLQEAEERLRLGRSADAAVHAVVDSGHDKGPIGKSRYFYGKEIL